MPRFRYQFVWNASGRFAGAGLQLISIVLLARYVAPNVFGQFSAVLGLVVVAQSVFDMGVSTFVIKERARNSESGAIRAALRVSASANVVMMALIVATLLVLWGTQDAQTYLYMLPLAVWAGAERNVEAWLGLALADGDSQINASALVGRRLLALLVYVFFAPDSPAALGVYSGAQALGSLIAVAAVRLIIGRRLPRNDGKLNIRQVASLTQRFWSTSVAQQFRNIDTFLVAMFASATTAGFYGVANRATVPLRILSTSLAAVLLPEATRAPSSKHAGILKRAGLAWLGISVLYLCFALAVPLAVPLALGQAYAGSVQPLQVVILGLIMAAASSLAGSLLQAWGKEAYVARIAWLTSLCSVAMVVAGAIFWSASGAALGLSMAFALQAVLVIIKLLRDVRNSTK